MEAADAARVLLEPDVVTQLQEQVALLSSLFFNYTGGLATTVPPARPVPCCNNLSARSLGGLTGVCGGRASAAGRGSTAVVCARPDAACAQRHRCAQAGAPPRNLRHPRNPQLRLTHLRLPQVEELADALPPREARTERMARLDALRADVAAAGAELQAELHDAGACRHCRNFTDVCTDCLFAPQRLHCQAFAACVLASQTRRSRNSNGLAC